MASFLTSPVPVLVLSVLVLVITPSHSQTTCKSQKFKSADKTFDTCNDLPALSASLHYSYNASNSSLSIAYVAAPAKPDGWVAWAINPTSTGMVGSQALIAFNDDDKLTVKTFDISSYASIKEGKLAFDVWDLSAESDGANFVIFATVKVPEKAASVNTVWQVGPSVSDGAPDRHEMGPDNLKGKSVLQLGGGGGAMAPAAEGPNATGGGGGAGATPSGGNSAGYRSVASGVGGLFALMVGSLVM